MEPKDTSTAQTLAGERKERPITAPLMLLGMY